MTLCLFSVPQTLGSYGSCWGNLFRVCLMWFAFNRAVFQSFPRARIPLGRVLNMVCIWLDTVCGEVTLWAAQKSKLLSPLSQGISPATFSEFVGWLLLPFPGGVLTAGCRRWELFLLAGDEGVDVKARSQKHFLCLHLRLCFFMSIFLT